MQPIEFSIPFPNGGEWVALEKKHQTFLNPCSSCWLAGWLAGFAMSFTSCFNNVSLPHWTFSVICSIQAGYLE
jgi:hypothetical protein